MAAPDERLVDAYVDALLSGADARRLSEAAGPRLPSTSPSASALALRDPRLAAAATELHTSLVRFHPSFRFEDRLAARLRALAGGRARVPSPLDPRRTRPAATVIPFPVGGATATTGGSPTTGHGLTSTEDPDHPRSLLLGGAIASGVSLAGAALAYAWRRQRDGRLRRNGRSVGPDRSLARAARAAHRLGGAGGRGSVIVAARLSGRIAARRQRQGLA